MIMNKDKVIDLKGFKFLKSKGSKRVKKKAKDWTDLQVVVTWYEYTVDGEPVQKALVYDEDDVYHSLTTEGRKSFTEKVFYVLGDQMGIDPYFSRELEERLRELYDLRGDSNDV